jgi:hypothetical protein
MNPVVTWRDIVFRAAAAEHRGRLMPNDGPSDEQLRQTVERSG